MPDLIGKIQLIHVINGPSSALNLKSRIRR